MTPSKEDAARHRPPTNLRDLDGFRIRDTRFGPTLVLPSDRIDAGERFMHERGLRRLELNHALGFAREDVEFLPQFAFITGFEIIHRTIRDITPIHSLSALEDLSIQTGCTTRIDFPSFSRLRHCRVRWRPGARSIFDCGALETLFLDYYKEADIDSVKRLPALRGLVITNGPLRSITPVAALQGLTKLELINLRRLATLDGIQGLTGLERLEVDGCPVVSVDIIAPLRRLRFLKLANIGAVESFRPLAGLQALEELHFWEQTDVCDGDLAFLLSLGRLREVSFMNRRHYSHTNEEIRAGLAAR